MPEEREIEPMLTTAEVARLLNVHINTVRRWSKQGVLTSYKIGSRGDRRYKKRDVENFFGENQVTGLGLASQEIS